MDNELAKKIGREVFEKLSKQTQALMLECFDHQMWLDTEQAKLDYIYALAQRHPIYLKYQNGMAEDAEQKIQRAFQTLMIEGKLNSATGSRPSPAEDSHPSNSEPVSNGSSDSNGNGKSENIELSLDDDLEFSLEGL